MMNEDNEVIIEDPPNTNVVKINGKPYDEQYEHFLKLKRRRVLDSIFQLEKMYPTDVVLIGIDESTKKAFYFSTCEDDMETLGMIEFIKQGIV